MRPYATWIRQQAERVLSGPTLLLALRMTVSSLAAFALATALALPQGYWAVLTALIVTQTSVGQSLKAALDRFAGSVCGAVYGGAVDMLIPHERAWSMGLALAVAVWPLGILAAIKSTFRIAPITAIIVLLSTTSSTLGPVSYAVDRIFEIAIGCAVGIVVSILIAPARAHTLLLAAAQQVTALLAQRMEVLSISGPGVTPAIDQLWVKVRRALAKLETLADEAFREKQSRLSDEPNPEPLYRPLRRLRHDVATLSRMLGKPLPTVVARHLAEPWSRVAATAADLLRDVGRALVERQEPRPIDPLGSAIEAYVAATDGVRSRIPRTSPRIRSAGSSPSSSHSNSPAEPGGSDQSRSGRGPS